VEPCGATPLGGTRWHSLQWPRRVIKSRVQISRWIDNRLRVGETRRSAFFAPRSWLQFFNPKCRHDIGESPFAACVVLPGLTNSRAPKKPNNWFATWDDFRLACLRLAHGNLCNPFHVSTPALRAQVAAQRAGDILLSTTHLDLGNDRNSNEVTGEPNGRRLRQPSRR
jgi:hypothetical protein